MKIKFYCALILIFLFFSVCEKTNAQTPDWTWAKSFQDTGFVEGVTIAKDDMGNIYTAGHFEGAADFDPGIGIYYLTASGASDIFISKLDNSGNFIWAKRIGGQQIEFVTSIAVDDSGNVFTAGYFYDTVDFDPDTSFYNLTSVANEDLFFSKLDSSGKFVWAVRIGGSGHEEATSIGLDSTGNLYAAGAFNGLVDFDPDTTTFNLGLPFSGSNMFVLKLNPSGKFVWGKSLVGNPFSCTAKSIAVDASDNVYITGIFRSTTDFDPDMFGVFNLTTAGLFDIFILKLNNIGSFVWAKAMGGIYDDYGESIAVDSAENVYTTGSFRGTADFNPGLPVFNLSSVNYGDIYISKLNGTGDFVWAKSIGGVNDDYAQAIVMDKQFNIYTTGAFTGTVDFDPNLSLHNITSIGGQDVFILKLDSAGNFIWTKTVGGTNDDSGSSLIVDETDNVYTVGTFQSDTVDFGPIMLTTQVSNTYVAKLDNTITGIVKHINNINIAIFPNPATNHLTVTLPKASQKGSVIITDIKGKIIYNNTDVSSQKIEVNTKDFSNGIYLVRIQTADFIETKKLIVAK